MPEPILTLAERLKARFSSLSATVVDAHGETTLEVPADAWFSVHQSLRDEPEFRFEQLMDVCGVDYLSYGDDEWDTSDVSSEGFSRGVEGAGPGRFRWETTLGHRLIRQPHDGDPVGDDRMPVLRHADDPAVPVDAVGVLQPGQDGRDLHPPGQGFHTCGK